MQIQGFPRNTDAFGVWVTLIKRHDLLAEKN
jgi:hypothetical protein